MVAAVRKTKAEDEKGGGRLRSGEAGGWQKRAAVGGGDGRWRVGLKRR